MQSIFNQISIKFQSNTIERPKPTTHSFYSDEAKAQKADDSRLILPINPDKAPKSRRLTVFTMMRLRQFADDSRLIYQLTLIRLTR